MNAELRRLFAAGGVVAAGKMTAIGLEPLKTRLGSKWERLSGLVHALFETAIKGSMQPGDAFLAIGELTFVVMYRDLCVGDAQMKCAELARHICARLFGEEGAEISIRNVVGEVESRLVADCKNLGSEIGAVLERSGTETIISADQIKAALADAAAH